MRLWKEWQRKWRGKYFAVCAGGVALGIAGLTVALTAGPDGIFGLPGLTSVAGTMFAGFAWLTSAVVALIGYVRDTNAQASIDYWSDRARIAEKLGTPNSPVGEPSQYFERLVTINVQNLADYYALVRVHTNNSFTATTVAALIGFALIVGGVIIGLVDSPKSEMIASLTTAAGLITEFISSVFFYLYNRTVRQLKDYHDSLLSVQNILLAFKVVGDMTEASQKSNMMTKILDHLVTPAVTQAATEKTKANS